MKKHKHQGKHNNQKLQQITQTLYKTTGSGRGGRETNIKPAKLLTYVK